MLKAALAHLWFVTIHPFDDGNGRIARAIADWALARSENSSQRFYSMSAQIQQERHAYYDILEQTQRGSLSRLGWSGFWDAWGVTAASRREQRRMPAEEPIRAQRPVEALRRIEHHLHHTFNMPVGRSGPANIQAQPTGDRRSHLVRVQMLPLDLAGFQDVKREGAELGLLLKWKAEALHPTHEPPLPVPYAGERLRQRLSIPLKMGPFAHLSALFNRSVNCYLREQCVD